MSPAEKSRQSLDGEIITIRRGLAIYKINASPYWFARIRDSRNKKNIVRSTKETSRIEARKAAEDLAESLSASGLLDTVPLEYRFDHFADLLVKQAQIDIQRGTRNKKFAHDHRSALENKSWGLNHTFGSRDVRELQTSDFVKYARRLAETRPDLSASSHNTIRNIFRNVMKLALHDGVIHSIPEVPKLNKSKPDTRTFFRFRPLVSKENDDYQKVLRVAEKLARENVIVRGIPITEELRDIILFTVHSFVRPTYSELYALKHADVTVIKQNPHRLLLTIRKGKTGPRIIDTMPASVTIYKRTRKRNPKFLNGEDYVFLPQYKNRDTAKRIIMRQFNMVLDRAELKKDPYTGKPHSMYS
ncbi:MAG: hypothetical protein NTZ72_19880, partial [Afipia sp.]|nr:hypothetical protein [Afipia sp.]